MRVVYTGSRNFTDVDAIIRDLRSLGPGDVVVHGACRSGVDRAVHCYARWLGLRIRKYPAKWNRHGRSAGPIRNKAMLLDSQPGEVHAFKAPGPITPGTGHCVRTAYALGIAVTVYEEPIGR